MSNKPTAAIGIKIREYITPTGKSPFGDWLAKLRDQEAKAKILTRFDRLEMGNFGDHKYLRDGVYELRIPHGKGYRVYYGRDGDTIVLLLYGGDKSSQNKDIGNAVAYWRAYQGEQLNAKSNISNQ
ncbi:Protein containing DUF891 [Gammaproteobacteria bacterium]